MTLAIPFIQQIPLLYGAQRSMTDLVSDAPPVAQSPKRKFSFRFPNLGAASHADRDHNGTLTHRNNGTGGGGDGASGQTSSGLSHGNGRNRNFSEELNNVPDLQVCAMLLQEIV